MHNHSFFIIILFLIKNPIIAAQSGVCLNAKIPTNVTSTIPNADQIAYAIPTGTVLRQTLKQ